MAYRPEVDGLRTVAVLSVLFFHAGFSVFSGGFVGVDIFFVISGYLISQILLREIAQGRFSFRVFYERRIRRIIPALLVVVFATLIASSWLALPDQLLDTAKSAIAAIFSAANFWFWKQSGYFSSDAEFMPLLHTWSLGVEEQFYIFFPILLILLVRLRISIRFLLAALALPALALSIWMTYYMPTAAFYLLPARAWELGLGALLAAGLVPPVRNRLIREGAALAGFALLMFAIFWINRQMHFPGWVALLPCIGTALILHTAGQGGLVYRLLSLPPVVFIGLISYSLYLWHWPVFTMLRLHGASTVLTTGQAVAGIALSFVLAVLSWRFVERPFRGKNLPFATVGKILIPGAAVVTACAVALVASGGLPGRLNDKARLLLSTSEDKDRLFLLCAEAMDPGVCRFGSPSAPVRYLLAGDSHAAALRAVFDKPVPGLDGAGLVWWHGVCPMLDGAWLIQGNPKGPCLSFKDAVLDKVRQSPDIDTVILGGRWGYYLTGLMAENHGASRNYLVDDQSKEASAAESRRVFERALNRTLDKLEAMGKRVIIIGAAPEAGFDVPHLFALAALHNQPPPPSTIDAAGERAKAAELDAIMKRAVAGRKNVSYIPITDTFCDAKECFLLKNGRPIYFDDDHLSQTTADTILGPVLRPRIGDALRSDATAQE